MKSCTWSFGQLKLWGPLNNRITVMHCSEVVCCLHSVKKRHKNRDDLHLSTITVKTVLSREWIYLSSLFKILTHFCSFVRPYLGSHTSHLPNPAFLQIRQFAAQSQVLSTIFPSLHHRQAPGLFWSHMAQLAPQDVHFSLLSL